MLKSRCRSRLFASRLFSSIPKEIRGVITRIGNYKSCGIIPPPGEVRKESPTFPAIKVVKLAKRGGKVVQDCDVYIGRAINQGGWSLPTSKWHNPFKRANNTREAKIAAIAKFEEYLLRSPQLLRDLPELRGKTLGCWCKTHPDVSCHGDVLKHYAECVSC